MRYYFIFTVTAPEISYYVRLALLASHHRNYLSIRIPLVFLSLYSMGFALCLVVISYNRRVHTHTRSERRKQSAKLMKMSFKNCSQKFSEIFFIIQKTHERARPQPQNYTSRMNGNNFYQLQHKFS